MASFFKNNHTENHEHSNDNTLLDSIYIMLGTMIGAFILYSALRKCRVGEMILVPRRIFQVGAGGLRTMMAPVQRSAFGNWIYMALVASEDRLLKEVLLVCTGFFHL